LPVFAVSGMRTINTLRVAIRADLNLDPIQAGVTFSKKVI
jgi:hypothetical protein